MKLRVLLKVAVFVFLGGGLAQAGLYDWFYGQSWQFMESVGGVAVGTPSRNSQGAVYLPVICDVSGLTTTTKKPTQISSVMVVTKINKKVNDKQIRISVDTGLASENTTCLCSGIDLGDIPPGDYQVSYYGSDREDHLLGKIAVPQK